MNTKVAILTVIAVIGLILIVCIVFLIVRRSKKNYRGKYS